MLQEVSKVECIGGTRLRLTFASGDLGEIDIAQLVPFSGVFEPLRNDGYFRQVAVNPDLGTIAWPNGADLCPDVLYSAAMNKPLPDWAEQRRIAG